MVVDSQALERYLRIASISIASYDYVITLPAEWRFYRSQSSIFHLSIVVMLVSNYGVFSSSFTQEACQHYYIAAPIFKVLQTMVSQVILGIRTFNIAKKDRRIGIALLLLYLISISVEWFTDLYHRIPVIVDGNCTPVDSGKKLSAWSYYVTSMMYDLVMLTISTTHLLRFNPSSSRLERVVRVAQSNARSNILNIVLYRESDVYTQGKFRIVWYRGSDYSEDTIRASIGYAVTWIMSQRILIHLRAQEEMHEAPRIKSVVLTRPARSARDVMSGFRSQPDPKGDVDFATSPRNAHANDVELDIRACVERSMVVDCTDESGGAAIPIK
ncbi:hypothetical protein EDB19DRAFT_1829528 [Suillus lakei]|nr:hypothetical protein EDB19DRAFT_1829528 [Suillus lakei]